MFVRKGDKVKIITGRDRSKEGVVLTAFPRKEQIIVEGVNIKKKHQKPNNANQQGGIVDMEAPIHVSNVQVLDVNGVAGRVGKKQVDGKKVRYNKKTGEVIR